MIARFAAVGLVAVGLAGCSADVTRFSDAGGTAPTAALPRQASADVTGSLGSAPTSRVDAAPIGAPTASQPVAYAPANAPYANNAGQPIYGSAGYAAAPPAPAVPAAPPAVAAAGTTHVVTSGETISSIARRYNLTRAQVAAANGLAPDAPLRIGQSMVIPGAGSSTVAQARPAAPAPGTPAPAPLAAAPVPATGAKPQQLAAVTPAPGPAPLAPPKANQLAAPAAAPAKTAAVTPAAASPAPVAATTAKVETAAKVTPADDADEARSPGTGPQFRAPVRGRVISGFGPKPGGTRNDGVNFAVPEGTGVRAAEDGTVAYAGNELKGYGNLVLIKHADGYVTAYAHNSEISVKRGDTVRRGQIIAKAGQSGGVGTPQLHFEIRKGSQPVDPSQYVAGL
ncbi:M23 family metallopeptidase [Azorhizobium doebereinerae]|uniref:M23 family metallopeptidase n=1 Tax=Azorhizobium doebereinerae TaxID=281091 RepID=UPI000417BF67|nr:M23 family metallopeptidase [Azorhizobium doebereinerae]